MDDDEGLAHTPLIQNFSISIFFNLHISCDPGLSEGLLEHPHQGEHLLAECLEKFSEDKGDAKKCRDGFFIHVRYVLVAFELLRRAYHSWFLLTRSRQKPLKQTKIFFVKNACATYLDKKNVQFFIFRLCMHRGTDRFGNAMVQLTNGLILAIRTHSLVATKPHAMLKVDQWDFRLDDAKSSSPCRNYTFDNSFLFRFHVHCPVIQHNFALDELRLLKREYILPHLSIEATVQPVHGLVIHIRNGDIFTGPNPNPGYFQPPCSFYRKVIEGHFSGSTSPEAVIVTENTPNGNPCIHELLSWRGEIQYNANNTFEEDFAILLGAHNLIVGFGTFATEIALMSPTVVNIYVPVLYQSDFQPFSHCPPLLTSNVYCFQFPDYDITAWKNTEEQRRQMVEYPVEKIVELSNSVV